jgi:hypothetical protein
VAEDSVVAAGAGLDCVDPLDALEPQPARATRMPLVTITFPIKRCILLLLDRILIVGASITKRCSKVVKIRFGLCVALREGDAPSITGGTPSRDQRAGEKKGYGITSKGRISHN